MPVFGYIRATFGRSGPFAGFDVISISRTGAFHRHSSIEGLMSALGLIVACGLLAIVYGIWAIWSVMQADAGTAVCRKSPPPCAKARRPISSASTRPSASSAWLSSYRRLAARLAGRDRLPDRRRALGRRRLHRHEHFGARQRAHRPGRDRSLAGGLSSPSRPARSRACSLPASRSLASRSTTSS